RMQLHHRHGVVGAATRGRLKSPQGRWEICRASGAGHIRAPSGVDGDSVARLPPTAAEVGGVDQPRAGRIELRHKGTVVGTAKKGRLKSPRGRREVRRASKAGNIGIPTGIDDDVVASVPPTAAKE